MGLAAAAIAVGTAARKADRKTSAVTVTCAALVASSFAYFAQQPLWYLALPMASVALGFLCYPYFVAQQKAIQRPDAEKITLLQADKLFELAIENGREVLKLLYIVNAGAVGGLTYLATTEAFMQCGATHDLLLTALLAFASATTFAVLGSVLFFRWILERGGVAHPQFAGKLTWCAGWLSISYGTLGGILAFIAALHSQDCRTKPLEVLLQRSPHYSSVTLEPAYQQFAVNTRSRAAADGRPPA